MHTYRAEAGFDGETWPAGAGEGDVTTWHYDEATGLLTNKQDAAGQSVSYTYAPGGKLAARTWARPDGTNALATAYSYAAGSGDLTGMDYSDATPAVTFGCDRLGRQTNAVSSVSAHAFAYDGLDLVSETIVRGGVTHTLARAHDALGRPAGFSLGGGYETAYGYDAVGRMALVTASVYSVTCAVDYAYLPGSDLISQQAMAGGPQATRGYEEHRNLIVGVSNTFNGSNMAAFAYENDAAGRRVRRVDGGVVTNEFGYNLRSELVSALMGTNAFVYDYDPIGNRVTATNDAGGTLLAATYWPNGLNQYTNILVTENGVPNTNAPTYDADGNLTNDGHWTYAWDAENRLIGASDTNVAVAYAYDYMGRRCLKVVGASTNTFLYDGWNLIQETSSAGVTNEYAWGLDLSGSLQGAGGIGGLLSVTRNGVPYYPCYDANGNITDYVDTNGTVVAHREYDAFANTVVATGAMVDEFHFWFSTKYLDPETGLYYYGYRYYSPGIGRWLSRDPIGDIVNAQKRVARITERLRKAGFDVRLDVRDVQRMMTTPNASSLALLSGFQGAEQNSVLQAMLQLQTAQANLTHPYRFANNNSLMWVDPDGELIVAVIVAAGAVVTLSAVLPDWDADGLTASQAAELARLIQALKQCTSDASNPNVASYLDAMTVKGVFEPGEPDGDDDTSETRNGRFFGYGNRTILSADFFSRGDVAAQLQTLIHESYHAGTEDWTENTSYDYADRAFRDMKCCLQRAGIIP